MIAVSNINETLPLKGIMLLYNGSRNNENQCYVEYQPVQNGKPEAPVPLSLTSLENLYTYMVGRKMGHGQMAGVIPDRLIYMNPTLNVYVWKVAGGKRDVKMARGTSLRKGWINYPPMIFMVNGENLSIYIYKGRLGSASKLHPAPYFNVYDDGSVCLGTVKLTAVNSAVTYTEFIDAWESIFFNSKYSHGIGDNHKIMKGLINSRKQFPWKKLAKEQTFKLKSLFK
jgi:PRTRC genetic system protein B